MLKCLLVNVCIFPGGCKLREEECICINLSVTKRHTENTEQIYKFNFSLLISLMFFFLQITISFARAKVMNSNYPVSPTTPKTVGEIYQIQEVSLILTSDQSK